MDELPRGPLISYGKLVATVTGVHRYSAASRDVILYQLLLFHIVFGGVAAYVTQNIWAAVLPVLVGFMTVIRYQQYLIAYQRRLVESYRDAFPDAEIIEL